MSLSALFCGGGGFKYLGELRFTSGHHLIWIVVVRELRQICAAALDAAPTQLHCLLPFFVLSRVLLHPEYGDSLPGCERCDGCCEEDLMPEVRLQRRSLRVSCTFYAELCCIVVSNWNAHVDIKIVLCPCCRSGFTGLAGSWCHSVCPSAWYKQHGHRAFPTH